MNERELTLLFKIRDQASKELKQAAGAVDDVSKKSGVAGGIIKQLGGGLVSIGKTALSVATSFKALAAALAAFLSIRAVVRMLTGVADEMDRIAKLSSEMKVSVDMLSGLSSVMKFTGSNAEDLQRGLRKLSLEISEANRGNQQYAQFFKDLNINIKDAAGNMKSTDDVFLEVADRIKGMGNAADRLRFAYRLFGEEAGPRMLNLLSQGSAGIEEMKQQAERLGVVFSADAAKSAENFNDALYRVRLAIRGIMIEIGSLNFQSIADFLNGIAMYIADNRDMIVKFIQRIIDAIKSLLLVLGNVVSSILSDIADGKFPRFLEIILSLSSLYIDRLVMKIKDAAFSIVENIKERIGSLPVGVRKMLGLSDSSIAQYGTAIGGEAGGMIPEIGGYNAISPSGTGVVPYSDTSMADNSAAIKEQIAALKELASDGFFSRLSEVGASTFGGDAKKAASNIDEVNTSLKETRNVMRDLGRELSGGFSEGWKQVYANVMDLSGAVSGIVTSAFTTLQDAATSAVEGMIDGSLSASDAIKQFGKAIVSTLISFAAQMLVMIPLFLLFNVLSGGLLAASGAGVTSAAIASIGGMAGGIGGSIATGGGYGSSGGDQVLVNTAPGTSGQSAMSARPSNTNVTINAMDAASFKEFANRPANRNTIAQSVAASTDNAGIRRALNTR